MLSQSLDHVSLEELVDGGQTLKTGTFYPTKNFCKSLDYAEILCRKFKEDYITTQFMLQGVVHYAQETPLQPALDINRIWLKRVTQAVTKLSMREFCVLDIPQGANLKLNGQVEKVKWLAPLGTHKPPNLNLTPLATSDTSAICSPKLVDLIFFSGVIRELFGDPSLDLTHFMLAVVYELRKEKVSSNVYYLLVRVFGYRGYPDIARLRSNLIEILFELEDRRTRLPDPYPEDGQKWVSILKRWEGAGNSSMWKTKSTRSMTQIRRRNRAKSLGTRPGSWYFRKTTMESQRFFINRTLSSPRLNHWTRFFNLERT